MNIVKMSPRRSMLSALVCACVLVVCAGARSAHAQCEGIPELARLENTDAVNGIQMGFAIDADGVFMVAGVPYASVAGVQRGAAYVYELVAGKWIARQMLSASDGAAGDEFGYSVAIDGDTIVVGATENDAGFANNGAVYVFVRSGGSWQQQAKIAVTNVFVGLGRSVDISGDRLIVGATAYQNTAGRAYIYKRTGTVWSLESTLNSLEPIFLGRFGSVVAIDGDTAAVVQTSTIDGEGGRFPRIDVFTRSGNTWSHESRLVYLGVVLSFDEFGRSIKLQGDLLIVGAPKRTLGQVSQGGAAYVFTRSGGEWSQFQLLVPVDMTANGEFGVDVDIAPDGTIVVGYPGRSVAPTFEDEPAAVTFRFVGGFWVQQHVIVAPESSPISWLGESVAIVPDGAGHVVLAADRSLAVGDDLGAGAVHAARITTSTWTYGEMLTEPFRLGEALGSAVDVEGDYAVVGAPGEDSAQGIDAGAAYVYKRIAGVWTRMQRIVGGDLASYDYFGRAVSISGSTIVVGAARHNGVGGSNSGAVYVFTRSGETWSQEAKLQASDAASADLFGTSVFITGDRLIVGAPGDDLAGGTNQGSAYVFLRSGTVWSQESKLVALDRATGDEFGISVAITNIGTLTPSVVAVVGAHADDNSGGLNAGSVYVFRRTPIVDGAVWDQTARFQATDATADDAFGYSLAVQGRTVVVGAPLAASSARGSAYVFATTSSSGTAWNQVTTLEPSVVNQDMWHGASVGISGQLIAVGHPHRWEAFPGTSVSGGVDIYRQVGDTWYSMEVGASDGGSLARLGESVAISGTTLFAGAPQSDTAMGVDAGAVYVYEIDPSMVDEIVVILGQPVDAVACPGETISLEVVVDTRFGGEYRWVREALPGSEQFESLSLPGQQNDFEVVSGEFDTTLVLRSINASAAPSRYLFVNENCAGYFPSDIVTVSVRAADFDCSGGVGVPDIFSFLSKWFAGDELADFDGNGTVGVPDIFSFLSAWFGA